MRKLKQTETDRIVEQRAMLRQIIKKEQNYVVQMETFEDERKKIIKTWEGFVNTTGETERKIVEATDVFKMWKAKVYADYTLRINNLKDKMDELYYTRKAKIFADYPIFMAIAEDIGYDRTGKRTDINELNMIGEELKKFIDAIHRGEI